jgi:prevent-host-death family protein
MRFITAKELRTRTRQLLEEAGHGEAIAVTFRGRPLAVLVPFVSPEIDEKLVRPFNQAWPDIEAALATSTPAYSSPEEALRRSRRRK